VYTHPRITKRLSGQWRSKRLLPPVCISRRGRLVEALAEDKPLGTIKVVNTFTGVDGDSWDALEITLNDGTVVPATRRTATKRGEQRCIFQNFAYKVAPAL
jgi:hypothetical protein